MRQKYRDMIVRYLKKGLAPTEIASAVALGNFVGILPFLGLHTVMAIVFAYLLRLNTVVVFLGTQISNPLSFPFILYISAQLGSLVLSGSFLNVEFTTDLQVLKTYLMPTLIGSILLGLAIAAMSYFVTVRVARRFKKS